LSIKGLISQSTFWGFKKEQYEIKFFPETYDYVEGWYYKNEEGKWVHIMLYDDYDLYDYQDRY